MFYIILPVEKWGLYSSLTKSNDKAIMPLMKGMNSNIKTILRKITIHSKKKDTTKKEKENLMYSTE